MSTDMWHNDLMAQKRTGAQIVDAVADAAHDLFVERSPSAVSIREIAEAAGVNLGLVHRYVGSKDDIIALVLRRHTERVRTTISALDVDSTLDEIAEVVVTRPATGRLMAGLLLDGIDVATVKDEFPLLDRLGANSGGLNAAITYALALGWEVFGPALLEASDASPTDTDTVEALGRALKSIGTD